MTDCTGDDGVKIRVLVVVALTALVVGVAPVPGGAAPATPRIATADLASAYRVWVGDFGSGVDGLAVDSGTGKAFVRAGATFDGGNLEVIDPSSPDGPQVLSGLYGYPVAVRGKVYAFRDGQLRRIEPTTLTESASWAVPGLTVGLAVTSVDGDLVWVTRTSSPSSQEQLYRFDPDTGTTSTSGPTTLGYSGPIGGGAALAGYAPMPGKLLSFTGTTAGSYVDTDIDLIAGIDVSPDGSLVTALDSTADEAVEYSVPGFVPTGTTYDIDGTPRVAASTTAGDGALAVVSSDAGTWRLRAYARGESVARVDVSLPPVGRTPEAGDLVFSADGQRLYFLVRDQSGTNAVGRLVIASMTSTTQTTASPIVVGSKGGAAVSLGVRSGVGGSLTIAGDPVDVDIVKGQGEFEGATTDEVRFTVPAMTPGTKLLWFTSPLGFGTTAGPLHVVDLGPFVNAPWFVRKQFLDITGKAATQQQVDAGLGLLSGDITPGAFISILEVQQGQDTQSAALIRLYRAVFLRPPDTAGLQYWKGRMAGGTRLVQVAATFAGSSEFKGRYGSLSNGAFVDRIYENVLGRPADPSGRAYWIKKLGAGTSRGVLVAQFAQSSEYVTKSTADVQRIELRLAMLKKTPSEAQLVTLRTKQLDTIAWEFLNDPSYSTSV